MIQAKVKQSEIAHSEQNLLVACYCHLTVCCLWVVHGSIARLLRAGFLF